MNRQQWHCPVPGCSIVIETSVKPYQNLLVLEHLYYQHSLSTRDTGIILGIGYKAIIYWLAQFGLARRLPSEAAKARHLLHPLIHPPTEETCRRISQGLKTYWSDALLSKEHRVKMERPISERRKERISRSKRAYHYGERIIDRLQGMGIDIKLAHRSPKDVGRAMMGISEG